MSQTRSSWQAVQDALAALAGVYLQAFRLNKPLSDPSQDNPICRMIHSRPEAEQLCNAVCQRQMQVALQTEEPVFFSCPANLHLFAIPVILAQEAPPEVLLGGKIYYAYSEFAELQEQAGRFGLDPDRLLEAVQQTQFGSSESLHDTAQLLRVTGQALIENSQMRKSVEDRSIRLATLMRIFTEISPLPSRLSLFEGVLNILGVLFNLKGCATLIENPAKEAFVTEAAFGNLRYLPENARLARGGLIDQLLEGGRPIVSDVTFDILKIGLPKESGPVHLFPLKSGEQIRGILLITETPLTRDDVETIDLFTRQLSPLLEKIEAAEDLHRRDRSARLLAEAAHVIGAPLNPAELVRLILEKATEFLQAEQGSLMLLDEESNALTIRAIKGLSKTLLEMLRVLPGEGISGKVYQSGLPLLVRNIATDRRLSQEPRKRYKTGSFISAPLKVNDRSIGVINLADKRTGAAFSEADLELLTGIATYASMAIERSVFFQKTEELRKISITDPLTGLLNRRYFQERLVEEVERSRRHGLPVSLMMIDIDDFKAINDTFGHPGGDEILKALTLSLRNYIRVIDVAARYGGEEFTIILPQTTRQDAAGLAERICRGIERNESFQERLKGRGALTISIGVASYPDDAASIEELIRHADEALYLAKSAGKNRVVLYRSNG